MAIKKILTSLSFGQNRGLWIVAMISLMALQGCTQASRPSSPEMEAAQKRAAQKAADEQTQLLRNELAKTSAHHVERFLKRGADVKDVDADGVTPLHLAAKNGHKEAVSLLLEAGADANATTKSGRTPLYEAVISGHDKTVRILLNAHANPNITPPGQPTALTVATTNKFQSIVMLLRTNGAR